MLRGSDGEEGWPNWLLCTVQKSKRDLKFEIKISKMRLSLREKIMFLE